MIKTDGCGDDGISGRQHPAQDRNKVHPIEHQPVADGQALVLTDVGDAGGRGEVMPLAAVVQHGKPVVVAFHENTDDGRDPAYQGEKGKDQEGNDIHRLPKAVTDGQPDASAHVAEHLVCLEGVFLAVDECFRLLAEISEDGRADDQDQVFEKREIKEEEHQAHHHLPHHEEEAQGGALLVAQPSSHPCQLADPGDGRAGGLQEKVHARTEKEGIQYAGDQDPFPQFVLSNEMMGLDVGLKGYNNFLKQDEGLLCYFVRSDNGDDA